MGFQSICIDFFKSGHVRVDLDSFRTFNLASALFETCWCTYVRLGERAVHAEGVQEVFKVEEVPCTPLLSA